MIIGTAGHIDHGKSTLIQALTGTTMDRLVDERRRGITIDLNFAALELDDGRLAGVIDVPGHEDFVRTMVAGASGIDLLLLVVAADEGVMPQTVEHLAIAEQLGVPWGIPVLTKTDLADPEWLSMVREDLVDRLQDSPIRFVTPVEVAAPSGEGLAELKAAIGDLMHQVDERPPDDVFRQPVDRAFSIAGVGTVLTGTCWSGSVAVGDHVAIVPGEVSARIRSIEMHGQAVDRAMPGERVALGLVGVDRETVGRGDTLVKPDVPWTPVRALDATLELLASAPRPLYQRTRVRLHLGTREVLARVHPRETIFPGQSGFARLVCDDPVVARAGDRLVIRAYSPITTIGGGTIRDPSPPRHGGGWPDGLADPDPSVRLVALAARRPGGIGHEELPLLLGLPPMEADRVARDTDGLRSVEARWVLTERVDEARREALETVTRHHENHPADQGIPIATLRRSLGRPSLLGSAALTDLTESGALLVAQGMAKLPGFEAKVGGGDAAIERVIAVLMEAGLSPPTVAELGEQVGRRDIGDILRLAATAGRVVAVERERYYASSQLDVFARLLKEIGAAGDITPGGVRDRLGLSRKFLIPLLEWADRARITRRVEGVRRLVDPDAVAGPASS